jgi:hypothetical protein
MKEHGRTFQCEPCRQIIIFFAVGCLALCCSGARASEEAMMRDARKFHSGGRRGDMKPRWQRGQMYAARRIGSGVTENIKYASFH